MNEIVKKMYSYTKEKLLQNDLIPWMYNSSYNLTTIYIYIIQNLAQGCIKPFQHFLCFFFFFEFFLTSLILIQYHSTFNPNGFFFFLNPQYFHLTKLSNPYPVSRKPNSSCSFFSTSIYKTNFFFHISNNPFQISFNISILSQKETTTCFGILNF